MIFFSFYTFEYMKFEKPLEEATLLEKVGLLFIFPRPPNMLLSKSRQCLFLRGWSKVTVGPVHDTPFLQEIV